MRLIAATAKVAGELHLSLSASVCFIVLVEDKPFIQRFFVQNPSCVYFYQVQYFIHHIVIVNGAMGEGCLLDL